ncbi:TetR/AcrR family transcriptional regulator [Streptomyces sp. A7024]|uniref:TetR/AcrR family transcriptional regulator n=1 Tax=Streptomyces coryli TaxID=1128680 RepID=A0A6G4U0U7_9ACTN|nr:TetR/AcrR family transcriptional regulator [Streptomyces coryli]NGN65889.1 TetR/AcrR family transcriptional regulator [Streptomyces coryli]
MARPPRYSTDQLLDAAAALAGTGGPAAVTMTAVAKSAGVPSGSLYHRFPGRPALLAEMWLRTLGRFHVSYTDVLAGPGEPRPLALAAARHVVEWSREHPQAARILRYGAADFGKESWPAPALERLESANAQVMSAVASLATRLGATDDTARERVTAALIEVPYGLVQRHLREGTPVPATAVDMAADCAEALLPPA